MTGGELLTRFRYILFVEGRADEAVLRGLYGPLFDDVGILILPISGIDEVKSLAELKIVGQLMDVGCGLLADHARRAQIDKQAKGRRTKEEQAFMELRRLLRPRGRKMDFFGLEQEDIIAYLGEDELASATPTFKTWSDPSLAPVSRSGW